MSFSEQRQGDLVWLTTSLFTKAGGVSHGFSTRFGGVSEGIFGSLNLGIHRGDDPDAVRRNYDLLCGALGMDPRRTVFSKQVHRDDVRLVTESDAGKGLFRPTDYEVDALITDVPGLALVIFSADCIPILLYDPVRRAIGAAHAGWRGSALGIAQTTVRAMEEAFGSRPADLLAAIGPGIQACHFETDGDVPAALKAALGEDAAPCLQGPGHRGKFHVDLPGINAQFLLRAGIAPDHLVRSSECTACNTEKYWSHRIVGDQRGSQAALLMLEP